MVFPSVGIFIDKDVQNFGSQVQHFSFFLDFDNIVFFLQIQQFQLLLIKKSVNRFVIKSDLLEKSVYIHLVSHFVNGVVEHDHLLPLGFTVYFLQDQEKEVTEVVPKMKTGRVKLFLFLRSFSLFSLRFFVNVMFVSSLTADLPYLIDVGPLDVL